jgi:hypothetical protein
MNEQFKSVCDLITWVILKDLKGVELRHKQLEFIDALDVHDGDYQMFFEDLMAVYFEDDSDYGVHLQLRVSSITKGHAVTDFDDQYHRSEALQMELDDWREASPNHFVV